MMMYYYRRRANPIKWLVIILIIVAVLVFAYWFYVNYFSKIEVASTNENIPIVIEPAVAGELEAKLILAESDVAVASADQVYSVAQKDQSVKAGDKIKTGDKGLAIVAFSDGSKLRLGFNTEISIQSLNDKNLVIEQLRGRSYSDVVNNRAYQLKSLTGVISSLGTRFEVITNDQLNYLVVLVFNDKVLVEAFAGADVLMSSRVDVNEKLLIDFKAAKKDFFRFEAVDSQVLAKETWYKWNFDLDKGLSDALPEDEPAFNEVTDSLVLSASAKEKGIYLSWSVYNQENFKSYKIVRSEIKKDLKYPDDAAIKSSEEKGLNTFLDEKVEAGKKYYYRVCVLKDTANVSCGKAVNLESWKEVVVEDKLAPASPVLSASVSAAGLALAWTKNSEDDLKEYKILRSQTNFLPIYPTEQLAIRLKEPTTFLDPEVNITSVGRYYYRVCAVDLSANYACSNVAILEDGKVK